VNAKEGTGLVAFSESISEEQLKKIGSTVSELGGKKVEWGRPSGLFSLCIEYKEMANESKRQLTKSDHSKSNERTILPREYLRTCLLRNRQREGLDIKGEGNGEVVVEVDEEEGEEEGVGEGRRKRKSVRRGRLMKKEGVHRGRR
jgi:hypothetical protein